LEKAREATDLANVRSAYAELSAAALSEDAAPTDNTNINFDRTGSENAYVYTAEVTLTQKEGGWKTANGNSAVASLTATGSPAAGGKATITVTEATGVTTIVYA
jgi:hypothetical protein